MKPIEPSSSGHDQYPPVLADEFFAVVPEAVLYADISAQAVRLYAVLRRYADYGTGVAHPSRKTLAARMNVKDEKTVDAALTQLVEAGLVPVVARYTNEGDRTSNGYHLHSAPGGNFGGGGGADSPTVGEQIPPRWGSRTERNESQLNESHVNDSRSAKDSFAVFYEAYPRKVGRRAALLEWERAVKRSPVSEIMAGLQAQLPRLRSLEERLVPHPRTWLSQDRWADQVMDQQLPLDESPEERRVRAARQRQREAS